MGYPNNTIAAASNIRREENPPYTTEIFLTQYPQYAGKVPETFLTMYVGFAHASINHGRYFEAWELVMGLFIAHFCTLYLQSMASPESTAAEILAAGSVRGLQSGKSAGGVSYSYDYATALSGLDQWGGWTTTAFGIQFATLARLYSKGGMQIW